MGEANACEAPLCVQPNAQQSVIDGPAPLAGTCSVSPQPCTPASLARASTIRVPTQRPAQNTRALTYRIAATKNPAQAGFSVAGCSGLLHFHRQTFGNLLLPDLRT